MGKGIRKYAGTVALAAALLIVIVFKGENLSDPLARKELLYCSIAIVAAVLLNWGIAGLVARRIRTTVSYIGWLLVCLPIALKLPGPGGFFDLSSDIGLVIVFSAGLVLLLYAYLVGSPKEDAK